MEIIRKSVMSENDQLIDRTTLYGNPFYMSNESQRELVCEAHKYYLWIAHNNPDWTLVQVIEKVQAKPEFRQLSLVKTWMRRFSSTPALTLLQGIYDIPFTTALACHCAPRQCHGEGISAYKNWLLKNSISL